MRTTHARQPGGTRGKRAAAAARSHLGGVAASGANAAGVGGADPASRTDRQEAAHPARSTLYDEVTARIVAEMEAGRVPWVQPWGRVGGTGPGLPRNARSGRTYSGINVLILWGR
jgi:hypothetical protein